MFLPAWVPLDLLSATAHHGALRCFRPHRWHALIPFSLPLPVCPFPLILSPLALPLHHGMGLKVRTERRTRR